jgi:hypothetical protein
MATLPRTGLDFRTTTLIHSFGAQKKSIRSSTETIIRSVRTVALLLLKWLHHLSKANWSLSNLASMLRLNLFTYRELTKWLHHPMETPPLLPVPEQLTLVMS